MHQPVMSGTGVFTPSEVITTEMAPSSSDFIVAASGIHQRYVLNKSGVLDPTVMHPHLRQRTDDKSGVMAEMATDACNKVLAQAGKAAADVDPVIVAASNLEREYRAIAIEVQDLLGTSGFGFDMIVACSSATFGIQAASDMIRSGSARSILVVNPEICSGLLEWRDRDCHFIFGDVCTATLIERKEDAAGAHFEVNSIKCPTQFSNNIRNNNGFLRRSGPDGVADRRDMQFMQNGRKVFGRIPEPEEQPNILQHYANTSSAGSIIAFSQNSEDIKDGELGLICSFGAGYSVGSVLLKRSC
ncbi:beta-ketoacyl-ACP synthase III [Rhodobacterales bacterium 52_120_T64]|nr:beta-ketoacyl-ACP synthase III [Rhodobacterales bacterium 52_120_T64]